MRTFEIVLLLTVTILPFIKRRLALKIRSGYLLILLGSLLAIHLLFEGYRWQMIPAYILVMILGWRIYRVDVANKVRLTILRTSGYIGVILLILVAWVLPSALPVFSLPEPRGPYTVGTEEIYLQTDKDETITQEPDDKRELVYKIWYPSDADVADLQGENYVDNASRAGFATKYGLPPSAMNYLDHVKTYVYRGLPVAEGSYPVLIFSHGYGSKATGYYALLTELASQGYVIINMNHTYESLGVTFPDGRMKYFDYEFQNEIASGSMEVVKPIVDVFKTDLDYEQRHPVVREVVKEYFEGRIQDRWAEDILFTIDQLGKWNSEGLLKNKLALDKVGVIGHSVGGGAAGNAAIQDSRIRAAVNLDGIQWGKMIDTTYQIPYLYVSADWPAEHEDINSHVYINKSTDYFYESKLLNSGHPNFMDIPFQIPVPALAGTGEIDAYEGMEIVSRLVTSFFDRHLKGLENTSPEQTGSQFDLLEMKIYQGDSVR